MNASHFAVDRIEKDKAVLIGDDGRAFTVPIVSLPASLAEGDVLNVPLGEDGVAVWPDGVVDLAETKRRRRRSQEVLDALIKREPGGAIET
ncbi:MAG TPA: DUF3006 domain-containing protein [Gemmatimonadales bacterium]|jgi:hypothetical protein